MKPCWKLAPLVALLGGLYAVATGMLAQLTPKIFTIELSLVVSAVESLVVFAVIVLAARRLT